MKSIYLYSTKIRMYWVLLPMALLMALSIIYTPYATNWVKLYPLMIASGAGMIFVFVFYFRLIRLNWTEIKDIGRFSPRDSALINEGRTLTLTEAGHGSIKVYLYGEDGLPELDWMRDQTTDPSVICMYRGSTQGGKRTVRRVLSYFGAPTEDIAEIISQENLTRKYENVTVSTGRDEQGRRTYTIHMDKTV